MYDVLKSIDGNPNIEPADTRLTMYNGWSQIEKACNDLAMGLWNYTPSFNAVIALSPDLIPATLIANALSLPLIPILYGDVLGSNYNAHCLPHINNEITSGLYQIPEIPLLLMVTTVLDNEEKIAHVVKEYKQRGHDVRLVTLFHYNDVEGVKTQLYWQHMLGERKSIKLVLPW